MNLDLFNNLSNNSKENNLLQNFMNELSNQLEKSSNNLENEKGNEVSNNLRQEDCLYQVVEMDTDGAYLQNVNDNTVSKETNIAKDILEKIGNDSVLRYKDGNYVYEEELTR